MLLSCNSYNPNNGTPLPSGNFRRVFVSDPVFPTGAGSGSPVLAVVDGSQDILASTITLQTLLSGSMQSAGMMAMSPKRDRTLVFSAPDNKLGIVDNGTQSLGSAVALPGATESFSWIDNSTAMVAVPSAPPPGLGQPAGVVLELGIPAGNTIASIPVPGAHYVVPSPDGSKALVFSDNSNALTLITRALIGSNQSSTVQACGPSQTAACTLPGFDRPVGAVFDRSGSTAYVLNCGPQCGGTGVGACLTFTLCTSVSIVDLTQNPPAVVNSVPVPAATVALLQGSSLYVAGTPTLASDNNCSGVTPATAATICGRLSLINIQSFTVSSVPITDGYHTRLALTADGQLFVGSRNCTSIDLSGGEVRGCLTIANVSSGSLASANMIAPPDNGDVTGIEPITSRNVVYVCEGGKLRVYDTTTDQLENLEFPPQITGQAVDVKMADF